MKKLWDKKVQASITVEAVLVVPLVLMILFLLISLDFYIHERAWYTCAAYEAAMLGESKGRTLPDCGREETILRLTELEQAYPLPGQKIQMGVSAAKEELQVEISGSVLEITGKAGLKYRVTASVSRRNPTEIIRKIRNVKSLLRVES
ncbi:MAG: pilus assembly protein [Fusicatenibacter sp.]|nr:pilus assembly protein [Fusicatenibacter sp.]